MHDPRSALGRALDAHQRLPAAAFRDDAGTPAFRARHTGFDQRIPRWGWIVITILWMVPALVPLAGFFFLLLWFLAAIWLAPGTIPAWLVGAISVLVACRCLPRDTFDGRPLALWRPTREIRTRGDAWLSLGRLYVMTIYRGYVLLFWVCALIILGTWISASV